MVTVIGSPLLSHCVCSATLAYRGPGAARRPLGEMEGGKYQIIEKAEEGQSRENQPSVKNKMYTMTLMCSVSVQ